MQNQPRKLILKPNPNNRKKEKIEFFRKELSNQLNRLES